MSLPEKPIGRTETYLANIAGQGTPLPPFPIGRIETYLAKIAGQDVELPPFPIGRKEAYLDSIAKNNPHGNNIVYGFHIDGNESDPSERVTYLEDAIGMSPAHMDYQNDSFDYGSWQNAFFMPRPCMLRYDGTVAYYLDPNDYTKKEDGTASDIDDPLFEGNAMMEWGRNGRKIWIKVVPDAAPKSGSVYISNGLEDQWYRSWSFINNQGKEVDHFYTPIYNGSNISNKMRSLSGQQVSNGLTAQQEIDTCKANNPSSDELWNTEVFSDVQLINFLLILIGKSTDTQAIFGEGLNTSGTEEINNAFRTGVQNNKGLFYGTNSGAADTYTNALKVFGMENWYGFQWRRIAGLMEVSGDIKYKLTYGTQDGSTTDAYNTTGSGYKSSGVTPSGTSGGYISQDKFTADGMFPEVSNGSSSTYDSDGFWYNNSATSYAFRGGVSGDGARVGALCMYMNNAPSVARWNIGCAPSCKPLS